MTDVLLSGFVAGYAIAIPVGAIGMLLIGLTARAGLRVGAAAALGVATADGVYALVAVLGGAALAAWIEPVAVPLRWLAVLILVTIAAYTAIGALRHHREPATDRQAEVLPTPGRAYGVLLGLTLLNPMTVIYFGALVVGRQVADGMPAGAAAVFVTAVFAASASWQLLLVGGGAAVGRVLAGPRGRLVTALASSLVIIALALALIVAE